MKIAVLDYGGGNIYNLMNALTSVGINSYLAKDKKKLEDGSAIFIPGVGAFGAATKRLKEYDMFEVIRDQHKKGKWIIGICLGMQLLFEKGFEDGENEGLGFLKGEVRKINTSLKLPHMGWNELILKSAEAPLGNIRNGSFVYFVHEYCAYPDDRACILASSDYEIEIPSVVGGNGVLGLQFHPEKSGKTGIDILRNIGEMIR